MEVNGEEYLVKQNDSLGSEKAYILYNSNNNWKYDIIQIDYNHWKLEIAAQIPAYYKTLGIKAQITVDKNVICNEHYQDEEGTSKTVEDTFSNFKSCTAPKDVGTGKIWNIEMKNGKCIKLTRFLGV